jgi:ribose/xylose/arabinose/galactoside ABC-type transport system permease subunit
MSSPLVTTLRARLDAAPDAGVILSTLGLMLVLILVFSLTAEQFFSTAVLFNILTQTSIYIVLGVGLTIVLAAGDIDISIGSIVGLCATIAGLGMISAGLPWPVGILAMILVGVLCGLFNGVMAAVIGVPSIIVTLGSLTFFRGLAYLIGEGEVLMRFPPFIVWLGEGTVLGVPVPVWIAALTALWGWAFLKLTRAGRQITAVGGNQEAARLAGISVVRARMLAFVIMGILAALATLIIVARQDASQPVMGAGMELQVLAAVVLGGTSLFGGRGVIAGTVLGALILSILQTGLLLSGVVQFWQLVAVGLLLIAVVAIRMLRENPEQPS